MTTSLTITFLREGRALLEVELSFVLLLHLYVSRASGQGSLHVSELPTARARAQSAQRGKPLGFMLPGR